MDRRSFFSNTLVAAGVGAGIGFASTRSALADTRGVIVAVPLTAKPGKSADQVVSAMRPIINLIRSQKGLLEEVLLGSSFPNNRPSHIHFMRWKEQRDWENLSADQKFLSALSASGDVFSLQPAEIFTAVKI